MKYDCLIVECKLRGDPSTYPSPPEWIRVEGRQAQELTEQENARQFSQTLPWPISSVIQRFSVAPQGAFYSDFCLPGLHPAPWKVLPLQKPTQKGVTTQQAPTRTLWLTEKAALSGAAAPFSSQCPRMKTLLTWSKWSPNPVGHL